MAARVGLLRTGAEIVRFRLEKRRENEDLKIAHLLSYFSCFSGRHGQRVPGITYNSWQVTQRVEWSKRLKDRR